MTRADFFAYVVLEGTVELAPVAAGPADPTVDELVVHYPRWSVSTRTGRPSGGTMVAERRSVVRLTPVRAYGMLDLAPRSGS